MAKFRKKPVVIEAVQISKNMGADNWHELPEWLRDAYEKGDVLFLPNGVQVRTLEGMMHGDIGSWIIQGVQGELYPCKSTVFDATYEPVEEE